MFYRTLISAVVGLLFLSVLQFSAFSMEDSVYPEFKTTAESERLRQHILAWIDSFESLACTYTYRWEEPSGEWQKEEIEFRYQGEWLWKECVVLGNDGSEDSEDIGHTVITGRVDGQVRILDIDADSAHRTGEINRPDLLAPSSVLDPRHMMGNTPDSSGLREILSKPGTSFLAKEDAERVLMYWPDVYDPNSRAINIHLDELDRITYVDYVVRPNCSPAEAQKLSDKHAKDLFLLSRRLELMDYRYVNAVWFPCYAKSWSTTESPMNIRKKAAALSQKKEQGEISRCELYVRFVELDHQKKLSLPISELHVDPSTLRINEELSKDDFWVEIPPGTGVVDRETDQVVHIERETWRERHANLILFTATLLLLSIASIVGWRYWPTNDAAR